MLLSVANHYQIDIFTMGTDISKAFDSVDRGLLLAHFENDGWMRKDEIRMTRLLLAHTTIQVRVGKELSRTFDSFVGTLQGDALSTLIFIGYLAGAMNKIKINICASVPRLDSNLNLPAETSYVDDVDYHSTSAEHLEGVLQATDAEFPLWNLHLNKAKTERTRMFLAPTKSRCARCTRACPRQATCCDACNAWWHNECGGITNGLFAEFVADPTMQWVCPMCTEGTPPTQRGQESWRNTRHLGTLLDTAADINKRIQSANTAYASLYKLWFRKNIVTEEKRMQLFNAFVLPHFSYNVCTQALTLPLEKRIDAAHRKLLRRVIGVVFPKPNIQ